MSYDPQDDTFWSSLSIGNNNNSTSYNFAGGTIINNNSNSNYIMPHNVESDIAKVENALKRHHVPGASAEAQPEEAGCMPGTRVKLLDDVIALLRSHTSPHIIWIAGMAGTGKTSIALTLCRMLWLDESMFLGGSCFCSRSAGSVERTDVKRVIPTLATLLARQYPWFASCLTTQISETPDVAHWSVRSQIKHLIEQPLAELALETYYKGRIVFVIDALDECDNTPLLGELIDSIADFKCKLPVKFLLTSRPEMHIRTTPISDPVLSSILSLHTVDPGQVTKDIRLYICTKLAQAFRTTHWCFDNEVEALVSLSGGLFIFASTVLKYVFNRGNDSGRRERLQKATSAVIYNTVATKPLDQIYELVITEASHSDQVDADELERMRKILACILTARASLSVQALADLIGSSSDTLRGSLERLHSLVHLPEDDTEPGVRTLHASFGDYMLGRAADHIRLAPSLGHDLLAAGCLQRMGWSDLRFNISRSRSSYEPNAEFQPDSISLSLIYACLHWAHHVDSASTRSAFDDIVGWNFRRKFLFWLEVLSITGKITVASGLLRIAGSAVNSQDVTRFLCDANSFVASSHAAIARSAPHIYISAVSFASKDSLIYQDFAPFLIGVVSVETFGADCHASRLVMTLTGHESRASSVAYSPSGHLLASGFYDGMVHIWDTRTGEEVISPMRSGDGFVQSVTFSLDGLRVASGTDNGVVSVWNVLTGRLESRRPLNHSGRVLFVAFSPDRKLIASKSSDETVGLWSLETGQVTVLSTLGNGRGPISLSFSPDGTILSLRFWDYERRWVLHTDASEAELRLQPLSHREHDTRGYPVYSSNPKLTLAWDNNSGPISITQAGRVVTLPYPLDQLYDIRISPDEKCIVVFIEGYAGLHLWDLRRIDSDPSLIILGGDTVLAHTISFSSDGRYLASGSRDCTIQIWDVDSGHETAQPVQESGVNVVAVSPDNVFIACGRENNSLYVCDVRTGSTWLPPLNGHESQVSSVAFSSDGQILASGSEDNTIRLWRAQTGAPIGEPLTGHQSSVRAVTFSPDAQWLASGSDDKTVLVWDVATGRSMDFAPMVCEDKVSAVAFWPSGQVLAAGDIKGHIFLWHLENSQLVHQLQLDGLQAMAFSPGASRLIAFDGARDPIVYIFDVNTGNVLHRFNDVFEEVFSVAWSTCERYIAITSATHAVSLWDWAHDTVTRLQGNKSDWVTSVAFSTDGRFIVSGAVDGVIRVWNVEDARSLVLRAEHDPVARLASAELEDGWLVGSSGELLLWVPGDYHGYLQFPPSAATVLGQRRIVVTVGDRGLHWGEDWHACWRGAVL